jgi:hypothetical protein
MGYFSRSKPKQSVKPSRKPSTKPAPKKAATKPSFGKQAAGNVKKYQDRTRKAAAAIKQFNRGK